MQAGFLKRELDGFWENLGQCCGSAGIADYFLKQYNRTKKSEYLDFARTVTQDIVDHARVAGNTLSWTHAEHRTSPGFTMTQTGYMQGAAGIGMHFLRMHATVKGGKLSIRLLDDRL